MKTLINLSNHPSTNWSEKQKKEWDKIIDLPFPNIPAGYNELELARVVAEYLGKLNKLADEVDGIIKNLMLQGEYSFCYSLCHLLKIGEKIGEKYTKYIWQIWIPTTERKVVEKVKEDGTVEKTTVFEFVRWRYV